jgi:hypothetical protein
VPRDVDDGFFHFARHDEEKSGAEIVCRAVAAIRTIRDGRHSRTACSRCHPKRQLAIARQAHLGEKVEIVLAHGDHSRTMRFERSREARLGFLERGIEQRDGVSGAPQTGRHHQRLQRRIRLHLAHLLGVVVEVIRMSEQNVDHAHS